MMRRGSHQTLRRARIALACAFSVWAYNPLIANPEGFALIEGVANAPAQIAPNELLITSHGKAIISWEAFSIAEREAVHFQQLGLSPAVLNRVLGTETSEILGRLTSNGAVYLLNPNGILIGPGALIETSSFIASTFDVLDPEFLAGGSLDFHGESTASVINNGTIRCPEGNVLLAGANVENAGRIEGRAHLAAGEGVLFKPEGTQHLYVRLGGRDGELTNSGSIHGGAAELRGAKTVRHSGSIEASGLRGEGGQVYLVAEEGLCEVSGSVVAQCTERLGGEVRILGDHVHVLNGARIDTSAPKGEGVILVGGDYQGKNPDVKNAKLTWVGKETSLNADATQEGNGGKVILWSDEATYHYGRISARGGELGGDGGFVEVSGAHLTPEGTVTTAAPLGKTGTLLFDPTDIIINTTNSGGSFSGCGIPPNVFTPSGTDNTIDRATIQTNLGSCNVVINSASGAAQNGDITVASSISWNSANSLTLNAAGAILINNSITNAGAGGVILTNITGSTLGANITAGSFTSTESTSTVLSTTVTIDTSANNGAISFVGTIDGTSSGSQGLTLTAGSGTIILSQSVGGTTRLGAISLTTTASSPIIGDAPSAVLTVDDLIASSITTTANSGTSNFNGTLDTNGAGGITLSGAAIFLNEPLNTSGSGNVQITNSGVLTIAAAANISTNGSFTQIGAGTIDTRGSITAGGAIAVAAPISLTGAVTWESTGSNITLPVASTVNGDDAFTLSAESGTINLNSVIGGTEPVASFTADGASINIAQDISAQNGNVSFTGAVTLMNTLTVTTSSTGSITFNNAVNGNSSGGQDLTLVADPIVGTVSLLGTMGGTTALGNLTITGQSIRLGEDITSATGKVITMTGPITLVDDVNITTGTGTGSAITFFGTTSTINSNSSTHFSLQATTRALTFGGTVGGSTSPSSLVVDAVLIVTNGSHAVSAGPMTYSGPVVLNTSTSFTNTGSTGGVTFQSSSTLDDLGVTVGGISGNFPLTITASNSTLTVTGDIDTSGGATANDGKAVTLNASGTITVNGNITTTGGNPGATASGFDGGNVILTSDNGNVSVQQINTSGGPGTVTGGAAGLIRLQPGAGYTAGPLGNIPNGRILLNAGVTGSPNPSPTPTTWSLRAVGGTGATDGTDGTVTLFFGSRAVAGTVMSIATIGSSLAGNDITIDCGTFSMGNQEVMTALGSIYIQASSSLSVGDLIARDAITLTNASGTGGTTTLLTHGSGNILNFQGGFNVVSELQFVYRTGIEKPTVLSPSGPLTLLDVSSLFSTAGEFQTQLVYAPQSYLLNFSETAAPTPAPTPDLLLALALALKDSIIQSFGVANSQMFYLLQEMQNVPYYRPQVCFPARNQCLPRLPRWKSWLPQNDVQ